MMKARLSSESALWVRPVVPEPTVSSTLPTFENELPLGVHREGFNNYLKHRGSLNLGTQPLITVRPSEDQLFPGQARSAKVIGSEATKNFLKSITTSPQLLFSDLQPPDPHHRMRVKPEARQNYVRDHESRVKLLMENYGQFSSPSTPTRPRTQGELARNLYETHNEGRLGRLIANYGRFPESARAVPHVKGVDAEENLRKGLGDSPILEHRLDHRPATSQPHVKGVQAEETYEKARGGAMNNLLHRYGHLPISARTNPKVKFDGIRNHAASQGDAMRKTLSQQPLSYRHRERPLPVPQ